MFKKFLFKSQSNPVALTDYSVGSVKCVPAIQVLSEHQRMRREMFARVAPDNGVKFANEVLEGFDKAFPDPQIPVRLPRPDYDGLVRLSDVEHALNKAGINNVPWNWVI